MFLPVVFIVGLIFGARRWPAVLVFVVGWPLIVRVLVDDPPRDMAVYVLVVLVNAAAGMAIHAGATAVRPAIALAVRMGGRLLLGIPALPSVGTDVPGLLER